MKAKYQQKYKEIQVLGRGSYGVAHLVTPKKSKGREYFVAKKVFLSQANKQERSKSLLQADILKKLNSPFVVKYIQSYLENEQLIVIMEYCEQGDLAFFIQNHKKRKQSISEVIIANWFVQLCLGLRHIHSNKILHRDIKSSNIFLNSNGTVKIGDFGISKVLQTISQSAHTFTGTPYYLSPQVCSNLPYGYKSDIWALGCVMYQLCTLNYAFQAHSLLGLVRKIVQDKVQRIPKQYSQELSSVILKLLHKDVKYRPTIDQIFESQYIKKSMNKFVQCGGNLKIHVPIKGTTLHQSIKNDIQQQLPKNSIKLTPKQQAQKRKQIKIKQRQQQILNATRQNLSTRSWADTRRKQDLYGNSLKNTKQQLIEVNEINKTIASESYQKKNAQKEQAYDQQFYSKPIVHRHDPNDNRQLPMTLKLQQQNQRFNQKQTPSNQQQQQQEQQLQQYNDEDFEQYQEQDIRITSAADEKDLVKISQIYSNQLNNKVTQTFSNQKQVQTKPSQSFLISLIEKKRKNLISQIGNQVYQTIYKFILKHINQLQEKKLYSEVSRKYPNINEQQIEQICQIVFIQGFKHTQ